MPTHCRPASGNSVHKFTHRQENWQTIYAPPSAPALVRQANEVRQATDYSALVLIYGKMYIDEKDGDLAAFAFRRAYSKSNRPTTSRCAGRRNRNHQKIPVTVQNSQP